MILNINEMKTITDNRKCTGCCACLNICPNNCIEMKYDKEGFFYPSIIKSKCVNCNRCIKVCPINKETKQVDISPKKAYMAYSLNNTLRQRGSSGGIFGALATSIIEKAGFVFGAAFNEGLQVEHICVSNKENLDRLYMSKYVQSEIGLSYRQVKQALKNNKHVLFTGTPCQIAGLRSYLGSNDYPCLITQEVACHGVPSTMLWNKNIQYVSKINKKIVKNVSFRKKTKGWNDFSVEYVFDDGTIMDNYHKEDLYFMSFLSNYSLRLSCYQCKFKNQNSLADITLADFWGIENVFSDVDRYDGVSLVICNTQKGRKAIEEIGDNLCCVSTDYEKAIKWNSGICTSVQMPSMRREFFNYLRYHSFEKTVQIFCNDLSPKLNFLSDYKMIKKEKGSLISALWFIKHINRLKS